MFKPFHTRMKPLENAKNNRVREIESDDRYADIRPAFQKAHALIQNNKEKGITQKNQAIHALACFLISDDVDSATKKAAVDREATSSASIRTHIVDALMATSAVWVEHEEFLRNKGALLVGDKFRLPPKLMELGPNGDFAKAQKTVAPELQPIIDLALQFALIPKEMSKPIHMDKTLLSFVVTQLMPQGPAQQREKQARLNALSLKLTDEVNNKWLQRSYKAITEIAERLNIVIPPDLLSEGKPAKASVAPATPSLARKSASFDPRKLTPAEMDAKAKAEMNRNLLENLVKLRQSNMITPQQGMIYMAMEVTNDSMSKTKQKEVALKFNCSEKEIEDICIKVGNLLYPQDLSVKQAKPRARPQ